VSASLKEKILMATKKFAILSGLLKAYEGEDQTKRLKTTASSTVKDRVGDQMLLPAINKMAATAKDNMTIFLNHRYNVPEDVLGSVTDVEIRQAGMDLYDLDFDIRIDESNPRAVKTWQSIKSGTKLGTSIGAIVNHWSENKDGGWDIDDVELLEASIVGIPANPRSWVQNAVKAIKGLDMDADDDEPTVIEQAEEVEVTAEATPEVAKATCTECEKEECSCEKSTDPDLTKDGGECEDDCTCEKHLTELLTQEAPASVESAPETVEKEVETVVAAAADGAVEQVAKALDLLTKTTGELVESKEKLADAISAKEKAEAERDEAYRLLSMATSLVQKIASTPVGRKTTNKVLTRTYNERFGGVFDPDFIKMLENNENE
jgi:HK97 family phage prohead protease